MNVGSSLYTKQQTFPNVESIYKHTECHIPGDEKFHFTFEKILKPNTSLGCKNYMYFKLSVCKML